MRLYSTIEPGRSHSQPTYTTHPWTFLTTGGPDDHSPEEVVIKNHRIFYPSRVDQEVFLERPKRLPFTERNYARFPTPFKHQVRTLLLSWNRLHADPSGGLEVSPGPQSFLNSSF